MNRRSIIQLLVGAIAALAGLGSLTYVRQSRCVDAGGQWSFAERSCIGQSGPLAIEQSSDVVIAMLIGLAVAWTLFRIFTFAANRRKAAPPNSRA